MKLSTLFCRVAGCCALLLSGLSINAAVEAAEALSFVTCPIYRDADAGRKSGCWLGDDYESGERYDITLSPTKPLLGRLVLVEGFQSENTSVEACGAPLLDPVRISLLPGECQRHLVPAEGATGHRFVLPRRNIRPLYEERAALQKPYKAKTVYIPFDFGRDFIVYQLSDYYIDLATKYALEIDASKVSVTGYAATEPVTISGRVLKEDASIAQARADMVVEWFTRLGYPRDRIVVKTETASRAIDDEFSDGLVEASKRRVKVQITP